jgi:hypothetical protein
MVCSAYSRGSGLKYSLIDKITGERCGSHEILADAEDRAEADVKNGNKIKPGACLQVYYLFFQL